MKPARSRWVLALGACGWLLGGGTILGASSAVAAPITGQVYDAASGRPARGISLSLVYDAEDPVNPGGPVAPEDLGAGQQGQVTGYDGLYQFDVPGGRRYRLVLDPAGTPFVAPSARTRPRAGFAPLGEVVPTPEPAEDPGASRAYYLRFDIPDAGDRVRNNHVAVDRVGTGVTLDKRVDRPEAAPGDVVRYTVRVANGTDRSLTEGAGRPVYIRDAPARGLAVAGGQAVARVQDGAGARLLRAGVDFAVVPESQGSGRLVRFGPFDLAAGAVLVLDYPATVRLDARAGAIDNRAMLVDAGGVALSPEARAPLRIAADPVLDTGLILGRVFCDEDGDGRRDAGEAGVMGARVYMDTGAYAVTDAEGAYHLSRVRAGSRLVKLDDATLAGGTVQGTPERLLGLSRGMSARVDFAVRCGLVTVGLEAAATRDVPAGEADDGADGQIDGESDDEVTDEAAGAADAPMVEVRGDTAAMEVSVAGRPVALPAAGLALEVPAALQAGAARNLAPVPAGGYDADAPRPLWRLDWRGPADVRAREWRLVIGALGEGGALAPVRTFRGAGVPPEEVAWDGLDDQGAPVAAGVLYAGRLVVEGGARRAKAASARVVLGVGLGAAAEATEEIWRGALFGGSDRNPTATEALQALVAGLVERVGPEDRVEILVHADGTGDRLSALVATQKQAELVAGLLADVAADRVSARGRGSLEPAQAGTGEAEREANRRVVVKIIPAAVPAVPETAPGRAGARVNRAAVEVTNAGFSTRVRAMPRGMVRVDMRALDGRRATIEVASTPEAEAEPEAAGTPPEVAGTPEEVPGTSPPEVAGTPEPEVAGTPEEVPGTSPPEVAGTPGGMVEVQGDLASGTMVMNDRQLPRGLLAVDARLQGDGIDLAPDGQSLTAPLSFDLIVPADLDVRSWLIEIIAGDESVYRAAGVGSPPATHVWNGTGPEGTLALTPGDRYIYQLTITTADGASGISPPRRLAASPAPGLDLRGDLFTPTGKLTPDTRTRLASLLEQADRSAPHRIDLAVASRGGSAVEARLGLAVRKVALEKALAGMGLAPDHYELHAALSTSPEDTLTIETAGPSEANTAEATGQQSARVLVNGTLQEVAGDGWRAQVPASEPVTLDITTPDGHRAVVSLAPDEPGAPPDAAAPAPADAAPTPEQASPGPDAAALAAATRVHLPPADTVLRTRTLAITGQTRPGTRIMVVTGTPDAEPTATPDATPDAEPTATPDATPATEQRLELPVRADGRFAGVVSLPRGRSHVVIRAMAPDGGQARLSWPITVDDERLFIMALGEAAASTAFVHREDDGRTRTRGLTADTAHLDGLDQASSVRVGPLRLHGRLALFARGRIPASALAPSVDITAHLDTARDSGTGAFFEQLTDPRTTAPVHGDAAQEGRAVNTRGPLYLRLDTGDASAVVGSMHTDLGRGDLFRYDRTLDGALLQAERAGPGYRVEVRGFRAGLGDLRQDVNWYRATGGSLYYLRHGHVIEGSERVRAVVRDALGGLVVSERPLVRDRDYRIDYISGRVMLAEPLASAQSSRWIVDSLETGAAPLTGNPVFLEVRYEHADPTGAGTRAAGMYARGTVGPVALGAGLVAEGRAGGDYTLMGADAAVRIGARSRMTFELAGARRREAGGSLSVDGGLRFTDMSAGARDVRSGHTHLAWKLTQDWHAGDLLDRPWAERTRLQILAQNVDRGFSAGSAALEQGRLELGALLTHRLSDQDTLLLRHDSRMARLPRVGPTAADLAASSDPLALDALTSHRTTAQWSRVEGRWHHRVEAVHQRLRSDGLLANDAPVLDSRRLGLGAATALAYDRRLTLRAGQQILLDLGDADPRLDPIDPSADPLAPARRTSAPLAGVVTNLGADWALTDDLAAGVDWYQRWNGDSAGQVGLRSALSDTGSMYLRQRLAARDGRPVATTVLGAEDHVGGTGQGRTYGEYQVENSTLGRRDRAVFGAGHGWQVAPGARVTMGYEHQHVLGGALPDGTPLGTNQREVVHGGGVYVRPERFEAALRLEMRFDHSTSGPVAVADQRDLDPSGSRPADIPERAGEPTADHGGVVPGAPAALPAGDRVQVLAGGSLAWHLAPAHTMLGRAFLAHTTAGLEASAYTEAQNLELTAGWAYRPPVNDWLHLLARYSHLRDLRPRAEPGAGWREHAHVLALLPLAELPHRLSLSGKLAWKRKRVALEPDAPGAPGETIAPGTPAGSGSALATTAVLVLARLGYRIYGRWDAGVELRGLYLGKPGQAREARAGALLELGYQIHRHIRLGIGYNMSRFSDDELRDLERDSHGAFIRVTGHY